MKQKMIPIQSDEQQIIRFSNRIFWDTDVAEIDLSIHGIFLLERVMRYGTIEDWKTLRSIYSIEELVEHAKRAKDLDKMSVSFLCAMLDIDQNEMTCYTQNVSQKNFWNF